MNIISFSCKSEVLNLWVFLCLDSCQILPIENIYSLLCTLVQMARPFCFAIKNVRCYNPHLSLLNGKAISSHDCQLSVKFTLYLCVSLVMLCRKSYAHL